MKKFFIVLLIVSIGLWLAFVATEFLFYFPFTYYNLDTEHEIDFRKNPETIRIVFTGDIMLGDLGTNALKSFGYDHPFQYTDHIIRNADYAVGNLEGPVTAKCKKNPKKKWSYQVNPAALKAMRDAGFDAFSLANNHMRDCGDIGISETIKNLKEHQLDYTGGGSTMKEAHTHLIKEINGVRVGFFGYLAPYIYVKGKKFSYYNYSAHHRQGGGAYGTLPYMKRDILKYRQKVDVAILILHVGERYAKQLKAEHVKWIYSALDLGFDAAICHGTHIAGPVGNHRGKIIFFGTGNYTFSSYNPWATFGLLASLNIDLKTKKIIFGEGLPIYTNNLNPLVNLHPFPLKSYQRHRVIKNLKKLSRNYHAKFEKNEDNMIILPGSLKPFPPGFNMKPFRKRRLFRKPAK